jgi:hypothetical protein
VGLLLSSAIGETRQHSAADGLDLTGEDHIFFCQRPKSPTTITSLCASVIRRAETVWRKTRLFCYIGARWTGCDMGRTDLIDLAQTFVLALVAVAQIYTILILRNELSRAAKVLHAMSMAMGEQSDLQRRVNDLEDEVAGLTMRGE